MQNVTQDLIATNRSRIPKQIEAARKLEWVGESIKQSRQHNWKNGKGLRNEYWKKSAVNDLDVNKPIHDLYKTEDDLDLSLSLIYMRMAHNLILINQHMLQSEKIRNVNSTWDHITSHFNYAGHFLSCARQVNHEYEQGDNFRHKYLQEKRNVTAPISHSLAAIDCQFYLTRQDVHNFIHCDSRFLPFDVKNLHFPPKGDEKSIIKGIARHAFQLGVLHLDCADTLIRKKQVRALQETHALNQGGKIREQPVPIQIKREPDLPFLHQNARHHLENALHYTLQLRV